MFDEKLTKGENKSQGTKLQWDDYPKKGDRKEDNKVSYS